MSSPTARDNVCSTCGKCFKRLAALENHERLAHPKNERLIKASCQERKVAVKKGENKKSGKKIQKQKERPLEEMLIKSENQLEQGYVTNNIAFQQSVSNEVRVIKEEPVSEPFFHQESEGNDPGFGKRLDLPGSSTGVQYHRPANVPFGSKNGSQIVNQPRLHKYLHISKNVSNGTYRCFDCKAKIDGIEFLFIHDCDESMITFSSEDLCKNCSMNIVECSCPQRQFQLVIKEKDSSCNTCGRVFSDDIVKNQQGCSDVECSSCRRGFPDEIAMVKHECIESSVRESVPTEVGQFHNDVKREVRTSENASLNPIDMLNKKILKPKNDNVKCPYCKKLFMNDLYLNNHMLTHSELQMFDCFYCRQLFPSGAALKEHLRTVHEQQPEQTLHGQHGQDAGAVLTESGVRWKCSLCPKVFSCKSNKRRHQMWHFGIRPHSCELCGAAFRQRWQLQTHKQSKRCQINRDNMKTVGASHMLPLKADNVQQIEATRQVEEGEVIRDSTSHIARRISNSPLQISPTPASQAPLPEFAAIPTSSLSSISSQNPVNAKCLDQTSLENVPEDIPLDLTGLDMERNCSRPFVCQECGKRCKTNRNLMIHKRIHTGERPYSCSLCSLTFRQSHHRKAHMLSKHGVYHPVPKTPAQKEIVVMTEGGIRYKCHYCSKVLMSRSGRRKHERWHLGLRPHKCNICGNMFKQLQHLKKHQMSSKCRGSQIKLINPRGKTKHDDDCSIPRIIPLTSWHMMQVLAENHRKKKALAAKDDHADSCESDVPQVMDVPSAVGLISTEELKAKERAKKLAEDASEKIQVNDENENVLEPGGVVHCFEEMGTITEDDTDRTGTTGRYALENDEESINDVSVKEEILSEIEEGELVDTNDEMSFQTGEANGILQESVPLNLTNENNVEDGYDHKEHQCQCHICGQYYKTRQNLSIHMRIHTGERPHCCSICSKKFIQPHHLKAHLKSRHDIVMVTPSKPIRQEEIIMTQGGVRFKCQFCPKLLSSKNGRQKHERWHLGLRPHKCDVCGKAFKQSHHLKRHKIGTACIPFDKQQQLIKQELPSPLNLTPAPLPNIDLTTCTSASPTVLVPAPTSVLPISGVPNSIPPTSVSPNSVPPNSVPSTSVLPTYMYGVPSSIPPTSMLPTSNQHTSLPSISVPPTSVPSSVPKDLVVKEALPGQLPTERTPGTLEIVQELPPQTHTLPDDTIEDMVPQDLSLPSFKMIDLHCYE